MLVTGHVADRYDRKRIVVITSVADASLSVLLAGLVFDCLVVALDAAAFSLTTALGGLRFIVSRPIVLSDVARSLRGSVRPCDDVAAGLR
jgi:MFS family permease